MSAPGPSHVVGKNRRAHITRQLNLVLLLVSLAVFAVLGLAGFLWYRHQAGSMHAAIKARAETLQQNGDLELATSYWKRYLMLKPDDLPAHLELVEIWSEIADTPVENRFLMGLLNDTLARVPATDVKLRMELDVKVAKAHLAMGANELAYPLAFKLLGLDSEEKDKPGLATGHDAVELRRVMAMAGARLAQPGPPLDRLLAGDFRSRMTSVHFVAVDLADAVKESPADLELALTAAHFYRLHAGTLTMGESAAKARAQQFMDDMVAARPDDPNAFVARYEYSFQDRNSAGIPSTDDLDAALAIAPDHYAALVLKANAIVENDPTAAKPLFEQAIAKSPEDFRAYWLLARIYAQQDQRDEAIRILRQAQTKVGVNNQNIGDMLALLLIQTGNLGEARTLIENLERALRTQIVGQPLATANRMQDGLRIRRAQLETASGNLQLAVETLQAVVAASAERSSDEESAHAFEAKRMLAGLMDQLGQPDLAAGYWTEIAATSNTAPTDASSSTQVEAHRQRVAATADGTRRAGAALLASGQVDAAIAQLTRYLNPPKDANGESAWDVQPDAWLTLTQAHLQKQLSLRTEQRNWAEFDVALERARQANPSRWELCFAEFERQLSETVGEASVTPGDVVLAGERDFGDVADFWCTAVLAYQRIEAKADAERALARVEELEPNLARRSVLKAVYLARENDFDQSLATLNAAIEQSDQSARIALEILQMEMLLAAGERVKCIAAANNLVKSYPTEHRVVVAALEAALRLDDSKSAETWEQELRKLDPTDVTTPDLFKARRLIATYASLTPTQRLELANLIRQLSTQRPNWGDVVALSARLADLEGKTSEAIEQYERAVARGVRHPVVFERLVTLLYAANESQRADEVFAKFAGNRTSGPIVDAWKVASAIKMRDFDEAIEMAKQGVQANADDPIRRIWLARLQLENQQIDEAEATLRSAFAQFPQDSRVWSSLFMLLQRHGKPDEAKALLSEFAAKSAASDWDRHFMAAQGYYLLRDADGALREARAAVAADGKRVTSRMLLGKLLMATDVAAAEEQFRAIIEEEPNHGEARRNLAILLGMSGDEGDWRDALDFLERSGKTSSDDLADTRLKAALLAHQGRTRASRMEGLSAARKIMLEQVDSRGAAASDFDRLFLAKLYEQDALLRSEPTLLQAAREQLRAVALRDPPSIENLRAYSDFLVRHLQGRDVPEGRLEDWQALTTSFRDEGQRLAGACAKALADYTIDPSRPETIVQALQLVGCESRLWHVLAQRDRSIAAIKNFETAELPNVEERLGKVRWLIASASLYSSIDEHAEAESRYRQATELSPDSFPLLARELTKQGRVADAVDACLSTLAKSEGTLRNAGVILCQVLASAPTDTASSDRAQSVIEDALAAHETDIDLLMSVAVLHVARREDPQAIQRFERIVELAPLNALALNNLATLLAENPNERSRALDLMNRAIKEHGRQPAFLDTLGTIQMRAGQASQAIASLEESVANGGADPRYYFHLAAAYQLAKQSDAAREALTRSLDLGLEKQILTIGDQRLLQDLKRELTPPAEPRLESRNARAVDGPYQAAIRPQTSRAA